MASDRLAAAADGPDLVHWPELKSRTLATIPIVAIDEPLVARLQLRTQPVNLAPGLFILQYVCSGPPTCQQRDYPPRFRSLATLRALLSLVGQQVACCRNREASRMPVSIARPLSIGAALGIT